MEPAYLSADVRAAHFVEFCTKGLSAFYLPDYVDLSIRKSSTGQEHLIPRAVAKGPSHAHQTGAHAEANTKDQTGSTSRAFTGASFGPPFSLLFDEGQSITASVSRGSLTRLAAAIRSGQLGGFCGVIDLAGNAISDGDLLELFQAVKCSECITGLGLRDTLIGDASAPYLAAILTARPSFTFLDVAGTRLSETGVIQICQATSEHCVVRQLALPRLRQRGLSAAITVARQCAALEILELSIYNRAEPLGPPGAPGAPRALVESKESPSSGALTNKKKRKHKQRMHIPTEEEDDACSLNGSELHCFKGSDLTEALTYNPERSLGPDSRPVENLIQERYVQAIRGLLLELFKVFEKQTKIKNLVVDGAGDDPSLRHIGLAFKQLASERQFAEERDKAEKQQLAIHSEENMNFRGLRGVPPVCLRVYFCTVLEQRLMSALLLLAAAKKELPAAVDSGRKEMAFLANALFDS
ncbi:hypothetical protein, conserved [Eimeria tenella]|uniref:Leucine rich repeat protein n=1 Tax=Eimeria tenella TaxID=5802 RepID=U6KLQ2_EIMTE|nr:hypothetical protein, conserved [Eimeria tenella]CDJ37761.1 hypothetical protein, conserved [Eimeria tenella]|eukprot:XP_013228599.1 hypothetical protein, conserved [Eimeria tenella]